jgi:hypothetical protein
MAGTDAVQTRGVTAVGLDGALHEAVERRTARVAIVGHVAAP